jgi:hypothetical protein
MAKPTGAITPGDGGFDAGQSAVEHFAYVAMRLPFQPGHWDGTPGHKRHKVDASRMLTIDAGTTLTETWTYRSWLPWASYNQFPIDTAVDKDADWVAHSTTPALNGEQLALPPLSDPSTLPYMTRVRIVANKDNAGTANIVGVYIEQSNEDGYTTPTPTDKRAVELTDRNTVRLYEADQPASAWHAQWLLCHTYNKMEYEARQIWSVPL